MKPEERKESAFPPRVLIGHAAFATCADRPFAIWKSEGLIPRMPHSEYVSLEEVTALLQAAKAEAFEEAAGETHTVDSSDSSHATAESIYNLLMKKASELRKGATSETGGKE